jgi:hypothetical protein
MNRPCNTLCCLAVLVCLVTAGIPALAGDAKAVSDVHLVKFHAAMRVGDTVLAPGDYHVQAVAEGDQHSLVFKKNGKAPEVRVKCALAPLPEKATQTQQLYNLGKNGEPVLVGLILEGDSVRHIF